MSTIKRKQYIILLATFSAKNAVLLAFLEISEELRLIGGMTTSLEMTNSLRGMATFDWKCSPDLNHVEFCACKRKIQVLHFSNIQLTTSGLDINARAFYD